MTTTISKTDAAREALYTKVNTMVSEVRSEKQNTLTTAQTNAVNSGITSSKVSTYDGYSSTISSKAADSSVVHLAGEETITGKKTIADNVALGLGSSATITGTSGGTITIEGTLQCKRVLNLRGTQNYSVVPSSTVYTSLQFFDSELKRMGGLEFKQFENTTDSCITLFAEKNTHDEWNCLDLGYNDDGIPYTSAKSCDFTNSIVTTTGISKSSNGYVKFGNGIILQWGSLNSAEYDTTATITFPTAFSDTNYKPMLTFYNETSYQDYIISHITAKTTTSMSVKIDRLQSKATGTRNLYFFAIGY